MELSKRKRRNVAPWNEQTQHKNKNQQNTKFDAIVVCRTKRLKVDARSKQNKKTNSVEVRRGGARGSWEQSDSWAQRASSCSSSSRTEGTTNSLFLALPKSRTRLTRLGRSCRAGWSTAHSFHSPWLFFPSLLYISFSFLIKNQISQTNQILNLLRIKNKIYTWNLIFFNASKN